MENIRQAIERAKLRRDQNGISPEPPRQQARRIFGDSQESIQPVQEVELDVAQLQSQRIVAFDGMDPRSRSFDILRTEVLQSMDSKGWKTLAVTSPSPNCGKTVTAVNLALSMARQREHQVLLVDLDLRKPNVAPCLGLKCREGVVGVLERRIELQEAIVKARVGECSFEVLPTAAASNSSDLISASATKAMLENIEGNSASRIVILDLPPLLAGPDVISILPYLDCVLFVAAMGVTKISEVKECNKYLKATEVIRFVLNKVPESSVPYAYY